MDKPAIQVCENFAGAGYPLDVEAMLIVEVEGSDDEIDSLLDTIADVAERFSPRVVRPSKSAEESASIWKGRKAAFGAIGQLSDYYCMDGVIPLGKLPEALAEVAEICRRHRFRVVNIFHAGDGNLHPLILYNANDRVELERAELCGAENSQALRQARRVPHRRARCRHREARADARAVHCRRHRPANAGEDRVRSGLAAQPRQGLSAGREGAPVTGNLRLGFHAPATVREISDLVAEAAHAKIPLEVRGRGSKYEVGRYVQSGSVVSTEHLVGISLYEPSGLRAVGGGGNTA